MSGSGRRREQFAPGLLPFMAVLLCTMGALVLILILMVSNTQASARKKVEEHKQKAQEVAGEIEFLSEDLVHRRLKQQEEIENQRQHLAHYEDHIDRLMRELHGLQETLKGLDRPGEAGRVPKDVAEEREHLRREIEAAERKIAEEREKQANKKPAFAILPYQGPNGTTRRPIYLECIQSGVRIQPEGVLLSLDQLRPPHGPGNPLDAALRLIRTEYQKQDESTSTTSSPYPLLLVRPDGIRSYSLARSAMGSWDDQFGYELIDAEMPLAFPPSTLGLADALQRTIASAQQRQQALAAAMPSRYREPSDWDDFEPESASATAQQEPILRDEVGVRKIASNESWEMIQELPSSARLRNEGSVPLEGSPLEGSDATLQSPSRRSFATKGDASKMEGVPIPPPNSFAAMQGSPIQNGEWRFGGPGLTAEEGLNRSGSGPSNGSSTPFEDQTQASGGEMGHGAGGQVGGSAHGSSGGEAPAEGASAGSFASGSRPGGAAFSLQPEAELGTNGAINPSDPPSLSIGGPITASNSPASPKGSTPDNGMNGKSNSHGRDGKSSGAPQTRSWSESRAMTKATPVVRDIRIFILHDRWLMIAENDPRQIESLIPLAQGPSAASEQLSRAIRTRMSSWGVAVAGGYWKPRLIAETYPDAQQSLDRLQRILSGSDVEVAVKQLDANQRR